MEYHQIVTRVLPTGEGIEAGAGELGRGRELRVSRRFESWGKYVSSAGWCTFCGLCPRGTSACYTCFFVSHFFWSVHHVPVVIFLYCALRYASCHSSREGQFFCNYFILFSFRPLFFCHQSVTPPSTFPFMDWERIQKSTEHLWVLNASTNRLFRIWSQVNSRNQCCFSIHR